MLRYLSPGIICSEKRTVYQERSSKKTISFEEQIMSKHKYLSIFSKSNGGYCVIILQIFFATRAVLKIGECSGIFSSFSWGIRSRGAFSAGLDQSHASENIWWIIINNYPPLATDSKVNSCFSVYSNSEIIDATKKLIWMIFSLVKRMQTGTPFFLSCSDVNS